MIFKTLLTTKEEIHILQYPHDFVRHSTIFFISVRGGFSKRYEWHLSLFP